VTRAALKGMSESIGVFIPILQQAANDLKENVDQIRRRNLQFNKNLGNHNNNDDPVSNESSNGMNSVKEEEEEEITELPQELEDRNTENYMTTQDTSNQTTYTEEKPSVSLPSALSRSIPTTKTEDKTSHSSSHQPASVNKNALQNHAVKQSSSKQRSTTTTAITSTSFISKFTAFVPTWRTCLSWLLSFFVFYMTFVWFWSDTKVLEGPQSFLNSNHTQPIPVYITTKSTSRSVYLRDLDEGFLKNAIQPPYAKAKR
jgi:hypothetical protein